jgi:hypothetical protein
MILLGVFTLSLKILRFLAHQSDQVTRIARERAPFASGLVEFPARSKNQLVRSHGGFQFAGFMAGQRLQVLSSK